MTRVGLVTGMLVEEKCLGPAFATLPTARKPLAFCAGADAQRAYDGASRLVRDGARALLSIGIAGGLDAALRPGDVVLPDIVIDSEDAQHRAAADWHAAVVQEVSKPAIGTLISVTDPACSVAEKAALRAKSGAIAVDMESGAVAAAAAAAGVPFLALRIIADPADRAIPPTALHGISPDGNRRSLAVLANLLIRPGDLPALLRLARDSNTALRQLRRVAALGRALFVPPLA